jgi:hypothetical protein
MPRRLAALAAVAVLAACDRGQGEAFAPRVQTPSAAVVLVDSALPPAVAGSGWEYHLRATADLDGDGQPEHASLIAAVGRDGDDGFLWDDGQPWQLYVQEADGTRTDVYRRFVQLGTVQAHVSTTPAGGGALGILIVENTPQMIRIYEAAYAGPGRVTAVERFRREIHPERGFSAVR